MSFTLAGRHIFMTSRGGDLMSTAKPSSARRDEAALEDATIVAAATAGDESAFAELSRRYRRELHVHCYRMLASFEDAEDLVQETMLRAWQKRETYEGRGLFKAWVYRIATNACLDFLAKHERQVTESNARDSQTGLPVPPHVPWLQPYPDRLLEQAASPDDPDARVIAKETIELAFLVAMQFLPPKQRAVLILRDVLDWSAKETALLLDDSVPAVNGALQRARVMLRERKPSRASRPSHAEPDEQERALVEQYVAATERSDAHAIARLLKEDVTFSMPPEPFAAAGRDRVVKSWIEGGFGSPPYDDFRCLITRANKMPAVACYIRRPGEELHRAFAVDVLRVDDGMIADVTAFDLGSRIDAFALPESL
jgi:RNA polymerase sigma-70 factor (ECF subfamily)